MKLTEKQFRRLIKESILNALSEEEDVRLDKKGNPIPRYGQGWGKDDTLQNRQGYNADGTKGPWFSRSVAVATLVLIKDESCMWYLLAGQRGKGAADYQGMWNLPCGYLDYNESTEEAAVREVHEETGVNLDISRLIKLGASTSPNENRQNVVFFYAEMLDGSMDQYPFSKADMEEDEVDGLQWVPVTEAKNFDWAFDHDNVIDNALAKLSYNMGNGGESHSAYGCIQQAIDILKNGGDAQQAIQVLELAKEQI